MKNFIVDYKKTFRGIFNYIQNRGNLILFVCVFLVISISCVVYSESGKIAKNVAEEQMLHRETVLVRAEAIIVKNFFADREKKLLYLSTLPEVINKTRGALLDTYLKDVLIATRSEAITDVTLVDENGIVLERASNYNEKIGDNISDQAHFIAAKDIKNKGKIIYSSVMDSTLVGLEKGSKIIVLVAPLWKGTTFKGVINLVVSLTDLAKYYLEPLKVTDSTNVYIFDNNGSVIASTTPKFVGINLIEYAKEYKWDGYEYFISVMQKITNSEDGKAIMNFRLDNGTVTQRLAAYTPIQVSNNQTVFELAIGISAQDAMPYVNIFYRNQLLNLIFYIISLIGMLMLVIWIGALNEKNAYLEGYSKGKGKINNGRK